MDDPESGAENVGDLGQQALLIHGDHVLTTPSRQLAASTVLLWLDGEREYRLESDLGPDAMIRIARSIDPAT